MEASNKDAPLEEQPEGFPGEEYKLTLTCIVPGGIASSTLPRQASHPDLRRRTIALLLEGKGQAKVAKMLGVQPTLVQYHKDRAIKAGEIVRVGRSCPHLYQKGPMYGKIEYKYRGRRRSPKLVFPEARVHYGNGSSYRLKVFREGDLHWLKLPDGKMDLFPHNPVGKKGDKHYAAKLPIPATVIGREGASATLVFYPSPNPEVSGGRLEISPPELLFGQGRLITATSGAALFKPIEDYVVNLLSRHGGWEFREVIHLGEEVHYAFSRQTVDPLFPGLMDSPEVHVLRRGEKESDYPLFRDLSVPEGELETTDLRMAQDLLAILTKAFSERTGAR